MIDNRQGLGERFVWWVGVVEDRMDPWKVGRCKVRMFLFHKKDKQEIPTETLPWCRPVISLDAGLNVVGPKEGDWVWGFFIDSIGGQEPVMLGLWAGFPEIPADPSVGFFDPRPDSILVGHQVPRDPLPPEQHDDGSGTDWDERSPKSRFPDERYLKEPWCSREQRNEKISETVIQQKLDNIAIGQTDIPTANHKAGTGTDVDSPGDDWTEAATPYDAKYPYNHVYYAESGHLIEWDDTPGKERLHIYHRLGTFWEVHVDGTVVEKKVNDHYDIVLKNRFEHIEAAYRQTVDWFAKIYINKDAMPGFNYDLTVGAGGDINLTTEDGKLNITLAGDWNVFVDGYAFLEVTKDLNIWIHDNVNLKVDGDLSMEVEGNVSSLIHGDKIEYIGGKYNRMVAGETKEYSGGDFIRFAKNLVDLGLLTAKRLAGATVDDFAPVIGVTGSVFNEAVGAVAGPDPSGSSGPPGVPPLVDLTIASAESVDYPILIQTVLTEVFAESEALAEAAFAEAQNAIATNANAPASSNAAAGGSGSAGSGGSGGSGGGGSKGPTVMVDGPGGFLWKPSGANSGVATILVPGGGTVTIYQAVQDGEDTVTNADGSTSTKPRYVRGPKVEDADYIKNYNGDGRGIYRAPRPGSGYGGPIVVEAGGNDYVITDPSTRHD